MSADWKPEDLWVEVKGLEGRCLLIGNSHTFPGGIAAFSVHLDRGLTIYKNQVVNASASARCWIEGFLAGNEPTFAEYLGVAPWSEPEIDDPSYARWNAFLSDFHVTGTSPFLNPRPTLAVPPGVAAEPVPWVHAGGEVWVWDGSGWAVPSVQPKLHGEFLVGSLCLSRGYHSDDETRAAPNLDICSDCGNTTELE